MIIKDIFVGFLAILFLVLAIVFLMGKGDKLIAGYNTASEEEPRPDGYTFCDNSRLCKHPAHHW